MFAKLLLKVTNIIKREKTITTIVSAPATLDVVEPKSIQLLPTVISVVAPAIVAPAIVAPAIVAPAIVIPSIVTPTIVSPSIEQISDEINQSTVSIKSQCKTCTGCGFVKTVTIICDTCNGKKCMYCNSLGLSQLPWSECPICYGSGEIIHS